MIKNEEDRNRVKDSLNSLRDPSKWVKVKSSNIEEVQFIPFNDGITPERGDLYIKFKNGGVYSYCAICTTTYEDFMKSESLGKYLNSNLKGNCLTFKITL
ncbi:MAG: KTSC domain-containing protein [Clostridium sp.]